TFISGSLRQAWHTRRAYYLGLATTWLLLLTLVLQSGNRGGTIGTESGVAWWSFGLTQTRALVRYAGLSFWPAPLIFDYGSDFIRHASEVAPFIVIDATILIAAIVGLRRRSAFGFLAASALLVLAPS